MGTRDILETQRGAITPRAEPAAFGIALADFLNRPSAWSHLRHEAPEYAKEWSDVAMAGRLAGLYLQLAGEKISAKSLSTVTA